MRGREGEKAVDCNGFKRERRRTSAPIGALEVKLEIMTDRPTDNKEGHSVLCEKDRRKSVDLEVERGRC